MLRQLQLRRQFQLGQGRHVEQAVDEFLFLTGGDRERLGTAQQFHPIKRTVIAQRVDRMPVVDERGAPAGAIALADLLRLKS